jgi:hypothetical protein
LTGRRRAANISGVRAGRRLGTAIALAAALAGTTGAGSAYADSFRAHVSVTGGLRIDWRGDRARGCENAGLCEVSGLLSAGPAGEIDTDLERHSGAWQSAGFSGYGLSQPAIVRVRRQRWAAPPATCVDLIPVASAPVQFDVLRKSRLAVSVVEDLQPLSSAHCAGPTALDLSRRLPAGVVDIGRLLRGPVTLDLSGRTPFGAGAFAAEIVSTVRVRIARLHRAASPSDSEYGSSPATRTAHPPPPTVALDYRIERLAGTLSGGFRRLPGIDCDALDACGLAGDWSYALDVGRGKLTIEGQLPGNLRHPSPGVALAAVRAGRVALEGGGDLGAFDTGTTTLNESRDDGSACRDSARTSVPELGISATRRTARFSVGWGQDATLDVLRARCPGPDQLQVLGDSDVLSGSIPVRQLGRRELAVDLTGAGTFGGVSYAGTRQGAMTLHARLVRVRVYRAEVP